MNGETRKITRLALTVGLAAGAAACANPFVTAQVDPASPIAAQVAAAAKSREPRIKLVQIPAVPKDIPTDAQIRARVASQTAAGEALTKAVAPGTWELKDTQPYADKAYRDVKPPAFEAPTDADRAATEAFAKAARGRASAPPSQPQ